MFKNVLTNPRIHSDNFVYMVHGIHDWNHNGIPNCDLERSVRRIMDPCQFYRASIVANLDRETAIERLGYYGKVRHTDVFGNFGMIIEPSDDDLVKVAWNCDLGSPSNPIELDAWISKHGGKIRGPFILLTQSRGIVGARYNELVLAGDHNSRISGVFFQPYSGENRKNAYRLKKIVEEVTQKEIPLIEFSDPEIPDYSHIDDPKKRELSIKTALSLGEFEILQILDEFHNPHLYSNFRDLNGSLDSKFLRVV